MVFAWLTTYGPIRGKEATRECGTTRGHGFVSPDCMVHQHPLEGNSMPDNKVLEERIEALLREPVPLGESTGQILASPMCCCLRF